MTTAEAMSAIGKRISWHPPELGLPPRLGTLLAVDDGGATIQFDDHPWATKWLYLRDLSLATSPDGGAET